MAARVLLVRPDHLGDVLLGLAAAALFKQALPGVRVAYLVGAAGAPVAAHCPDVDEVVVAPFPPPAESLTPAAWAPTAMGVAGSLRGRFDVALVLRPDDPCGGAVTAAARVPARFGFDVAATRPFLTHALPPPGQRHATAQALDLARTALTHLGVHPPLADPAGCFRPTPGEETEAAALSGDQVVLHPGSGWRLKNWPTDRWGRLAAELAAREGLRPLVVGGPDAGDVVAAVVAAGAGSALAAGPLSLGALAALHRRARLVVATDSGPLHLAAMMGAPVVGLYGPADPAVFTPVAPAARARIVRLNLPCSPCGRLDHPPCGVTTDPACLTGIQVDDVLAAAAAVSRRLAH
jgi:heptosyltransferase-3